MRRRARVQVACLGAVVRRLRPRFPPILAGRSRRAAGPRSSAMALARELVVVSCLVGGVLGQTAPAPLAAALQAELQTQRAAARAPGLTAAVRLADGAVVAVAVGVRELGGEEPLVPTDRLFCGSVGKTWFAALALELVAAGKLSLDDLVARHLGEQPWWSRLPNHATLRVRNLLRHDSGLPRWIENREGMRAWAEGKRAWPPGAQLEYVFDAAPVHAVGEGWAYSDTNYIVLGLVIEHVTKRPIYDLVQERLLTPQGLRDTVPGNARTIAGLTQGHVRLFRRLGFAERALADGRLTFDPAAEWCGGGYATTAPDLARWAHTFGRSPDRLEHAVAAPGLGRGMRYGLGVMLHDTALGPARGHDGVFLGYGASMRWFERHDIACAVLANCDDASRVLPAAVVALAKVAVAAAVPALGDK